MSQPRSINSTNPFLSTVWEYLEKGWSPLPLPEKRKEYPPVGFTGRAGKFATQDDINQWLGPYQKGNIALRLGNVVDINGVRHEVIGIDVDAYGNKLGGRNLQLLEKKYGKLPDTWTSSSRTDGISGIRYFLVPYGYGYKGQAAKCIDIIQRVHRYAVAYPSWHPETKAQYFWYGPGQMPDGANMSSHVPHVRELAFLPDDWIVELTDGKRLDSEGQYGIDLDSTPEELKRWRTKHFNKGSKCAFMERQVVNWIKRIEESPSNHDVITRAHWHLLLSGAEGHSGVEDAIQEINSVWIKDVAKKRPEHVAKREISRSYWGCLRKLKAMADGFREMNLGLFTSEVCMEDWKAPPSPKSDPDKPWIYRVPLVNKGIDPKNYDKNDLGMARMFYDRVEDNVRYLSDYNGWIIYDGTRWHLDDFSYVRDLFDRAVVKPMKKHGLKLEVKLREHESRGGTRDDNIGKPMEELRKKCEWVALYYGNDAKIKAALSCMQSIPGVAMRYSELNHNTRVLAMPNGNVILLDEPGKPKPNSKGFSIVPNEKGYFATLFTSVALESSISKSEQKLWNDYLDRFLPDKSYRRYVQKVLGYILIGGNPDRKSIWLVGPSSTGKSTILHALEETLSGYGATFQPNSVLKESTSNNNPELGNLLFKRAIFSSELGGQRISSEVFKQITGCDNISITRKWANEQIYGTPHFTMVVATNNPPSINDMDQATIRRIIVCPFETQVSSKDDDKRADVKLGREAKHAVLSWLVYGYRMYIREGLDNLHPKMIAATNDFVVDSNDIASFLNDVVEVADEDVKFELFNENATPSKESELLHDRWSKVTTSQLYQMHVDYCNRSSRKPFVPMHFGRKVSSIFGVKTKTRKIDKKVERYYLGLKWKNEKSVLNSVI